MLTLVKRLVREEEGQTMAEYALILVLVAVVLIATWGTLTDAIGAAVDEISTELENTHTP